MSIQSEFPDMGEALAERDELRKEIDEMVARQEAGQPVTAEEREELIARIALNTERLEVVLEALTARHAELVGA